MMWRVFLCIVFATHSIEEDCLKLGISTQCCADFYMKGKKCIPCPKGYFGLNCSYMCPYPTYGRRCLDGKCTCPKEYCNANTGCGTQRILDSNVNDHQHNGKINNAKKSESSSTAVTVISIVFTLIILMLVMVIVLYIKGKIKIRNQFFSSKRGSRVASQRKTTTYYEIDEKKMEENELDNKCPEPEIYELIDQSKKDATKYTELPMRQGVSKQERKLISTISMHKVLDDARDDYKDEEKCVANKKSEVQMRTDKVHHAVFLKRMGKTPSKISGYSETEKNISEDNVSMTDQKMNI